MAAVSVSRLLLTRFPLHHLTRRPIDHVLRRSLTTSTGGLEGKPIKHYNVVLLRVGLVIVPFTYVGYWVGGQFAEFLEEYEFYIPDEDEDD